MSSNFVDDDGVTRLRGRIVGQQAGAGSPVDSVTPEHTGAVYFDTTDGAIYLAQGPTSADWLALGGVPGNIGEAAGLVFLNAAPAGYLLVGDRDVDTGTVVIGTTYSQWNGAGQGLEWNGASAGNLGIKTGANGEHLSRFIDGVFQVGHTIQAQNLPTADPLVADQLWNDSGTVKISAGPPP